MKIVIREDVLEYMTGLKEWVDTIKDDEFEEMDEFFTSRVNNYEEHMNHWEKAYKCMANQIPINTQELLDIGCGTGLELDYIFEILSDIKVTGIDLCQTMLNELMYKHPKKNVSLICGDYFKVPFPKEKYNVAISFQSLHHFKGEHKLTLFKKIYDSLKNGGKYIECDYLACCIEEEELLAKKCDIIRKKANLSDDVFIHFDTPLTVEHEIELLKSAGFLKIDVISSINGATMITCKK